MQARLISAQLALEVGLHIEGDMGGFIKRQQHHIAVFLNHQAGDTPLKRQHLDPCREVDAKGAAG